MHIFTFRHLRFDFIYSIEWLKFFSPQKALKIPEQVMGAKHCAVFTLDFLLSIKYSLLSMPNCSL